jgi:hypothetical protein
LNGEIKKNNKSYRGEKKLEIKKIKIKLKNIISSI